MTTLVATGIQTMIADVDAFRSWVGAADQAEALEHALLAGADEGDYTRPIALILTTASQVARRFAGGSRDYFDDPGRVLVLFEADVDEVDAGSIEDTYVAFCNDVGPVISGILELAGQEGYPHLRAVPLEHVPQRSDDEELPDDYMQCAWVIERGI